MNESHRQWRVGRVERLRTLWRLGPPSVARVASYRFAKRVGLWQRLTPVGIGWSEPLFRVPTGHVGAGSADDDLTSETPARARPLGMSPTPRFDELIAEAEELVSGRLRMFSRPAIEVGDPPHWHADPYHPGVELDPRAHWSRRSGQVADIKTVWESSRFVWAPTLARAWRATGDTRYTDTLQRWTTDWTQHNPANAGPNWECGQETSLRLLHTLLAAHLLGCATEPEPGLVRFVREHVDRVRATTTYAIGQDNNHGTSEAAALFVGGMWLAEHGGANEWKVAARGRRMLEERVARLVSADGSFSQYSVNYHRVLLDTLSIAEWWRRELDRPPFSQRFYDRAAAATTWLYELTDPRSGDAPNIGANDGALLLGLSSAGYRDYRPSVQLASALFCDARAYAEETADEMACWLGVEVPADRMPPRTSRLFPDGGWVTLHAPDGNSWACLRFPAFRFRPSHADALHLDLWSGGVNLVRDAGSFGYAAEEPWLGYFPGTAAHSTVEFDHRDQMPRISRFLFGGWTRAERVGSVHVGEDGSVEWSGAYRDERGCRHERAVVGAHDGVWTIIDTTAGARESVVARWRLIEGDYVIKGATCTGPRIGIRIETEGEVTATLSEGYDSRFYLERTALPVLEVDIGRGPAETTTTIRVREDGNLESMA